MRKRSRIVFAALGLVLLGTVAWKISRPQEPIYQGKPLSIWLREYNSGTVGPEWKETDEAVRHMGTNAIPILLKMLQAKDHSPVIIKIIQLAQKKHILEIHYSTASQKHFQAAWGFGALGSNAQEAVPQLIEIYNRKLSGTSQTSAGAALGAIGNPARKAVPSLLGEITSTNNAIRINAIASLGHIHAEPELVVPALIKSLNDPFPYAQLFAAMGLGEFGTNAKPAVPALVALLDSQAKQMVKNSITNALKAIDPEAAAKAGVK